MNDIIKPTPQDMGINLPDVESDEFAARELRELGLEVRPEHVRAINEMKNTSNYPAGYDDVASQLDTPEQLKIAMQQRGITSIIHAEAATVWGHVKAVIQAVDALDLSGDQQRELKLIMLYHDLGKTEVWHDEQNTTGTAKHLEKGALHVSMIGHEKAKLEQMRQGIAAAGIESQKLERFMKVILNHMNTSILQQDPKKVFALIESFGETEQERRATLEMLINALYVDGMATQKVELIDGELINTKNEKKISLNFDQFWAKYEEGKRLIAQEKEALEQKRKDDEFEQAVLGMKLSQYLIQKGIKPGPELGKHIAAAKAAIASNREKNPEEIRQLVDSAINL